MATYIENPRCGAFEFIYHKGDISIDCNHEHLSSGRGAKILYRILQESTAQNRRHFQFREFKRDRTIFPRRKEAPFEVYLARLMKMMNERYPQIRFSRTGRGRFTFCFEDEASIRVLTDEV